MNINTKQIGKFLKSLNGAEYEYLKISINIRNGITSAIEKYDLSKEEVCSRFKIKEKDYENFVKGNFVYAISHMATLNSIFMEYSTPFTFG